MRQPMDILYKVANAYQGLIDYFVPASLENDRSGANQARMFLISHTMGPILGNSVPLALYMFDPTPGYDVLVLALSITAFWLFPPLLKREWSYKWLVMSSVALLNFAILWSCYFYGGVASPTLPWILIIPILSLFYIGGERHLQPHLLGISGGAFTLFLITYFYFEPETNDMPIVAMQGLGLVSTTAALCYIATMAIYYSRIFDAGLELENEVKRRMKTTDELRTAVAAADRASSVKSEFLARMSHELRTPLNAVLGYTELLKEDSEDIGDTASVKDIDRIHDAASYLIRLINMILDMSKIEAGRMSFDYRPHNLKSTIERGVQNVGYLIERTGNQVEFQLFDNLETVVMDQGRFLQVVEAVLENAAQHTENGTITISAKGTTMHRGEQGFELVIQDTGEGIPASELGMIFESFGAARDASDDGRYGGTGLSLTVMKKMCHAMRGMIEAQSVEGEGSKFTITLPIRQYVASNQDRDTGQLTLKAVA